MIVIPADKQTRLYELTYLLPANLTESELTAARETITKLVEQHRGKILASEDWGKRLLAYQLKHHGKRLREAVYTFLVLEMLPEKLRQFEQKLRLHDALARYLLVVGDIQDKAAIQKPGDEKAKDEEKEKPAER